MHTTEQAAEFRKPLAEMPFQSFAFVSFAKERRRQKMPIVSGSGSLWSFTAVPTRLQRAPRRKPNTDELYCNQLRHAYNATAKA